MKQALLAGRTAGLRPAQRRQLERLSHRRHPEDALADLISLQRLAAASQELELPLSLVVDGRGLTRLLWVGPLQQSGQLLEKLPGGRRRQSGGVRLVSCCPRGMPLEPGPQEGVVALDLQPDLWLRFADRPGKGGQWPATVLVPSTAANPWQVQASGELAALATTPAPEAGTADQAPAGQPPPDRSGQGRGERVLLLVLCQEPRPACERRIAEMEGLVRSAGGHPIGVVEQRRSQVTPHTIWGEGKLAEAALEARRLGAELVVTDRELTPVQVRNLERLLDLPVSDRSEVILDIFAQRAGSAAGRLQVELAQLRYRLPRLTGRGRSLSRQGGGIGTRGPGETQLEKDRRAIARRIERLQRQVVDLGAHRARLRQGRGQQHRLALVGYTNAGKSSLLNALTRSQGRQAVLVANQLFATLDPTTRRLELPAQGAGDKETGLPPQPPEAVLITDTVGFIRDLPPPLVEAFRSTLEETLDADGLLVVVDLSDPAWPEQRQTVHTILDQLGAGSRRRLVANQIDRCPAGELERARALEPDALFVSATAGLGLRHLKGELALWLRDSAAAAGPASGSDRCPPRPCPSPP